MLAVFVASSARSSLSVYALLLAAVSMFVFYAPVVAKRSKRLTAAFIVAAVVALGVVVFAEEADFVLVPPPQCANLTWTDLEWWELGCWHW